MNAALSLSHTDSPLGPITLGFTARGLAICSFGEAKLDCEALAQGLGGALVEGEHALHDQAVQELAAYFKGELQAFSLPLDPQGSPFQLEVWQALVEIPYGETTSYGQLAERLGKPLGASRAVGAANGANKIAILIPCHRVIGADGSLTGYAGGMERKRALLDLEGARHAESGVMRLF